jgi:BUD22
MRVIPGDIVNTKISNAHKKLSKLLKNARTIAIQNTISKQVKAAKTAEESTKNKALEAVKQLKALNIILLTWKYMSLQVNAYFAPADVVSIHTFNKDLLQHKDAQLDEHEENLAQFKHLKPVLDSFLAELDRTVTGKKIVKVKKEITAPAKKPEMHKERTSLLTAPTTDVTSTVSAKATPTATETAASDPANDDKEQEEYDMMISEDEWHSDSGDSVELAERTPVGKKNRRGQRARQAIWEKKYGKKAKHVVNPKPKPVPAPVVKPTKPVIAVDPTLHPSWQAKKANKVGIEAFAGKKIVFGDDSEPSKPMAMPAKPQIAKKAPAPVEENLHPSWEAKRKAKEAAAELLKNAKRTKITFDD